MNRQRCSTALSSITRLDALYEHARTIEPKVTRGAMFGRPAIFVGRKMAACVFGNEVALKIPAELADTIIASRRATRFTAYGKPKMCEWVSRCLSPKAVSMVFPTYSLQRFPMRKPLTPD
jgi:hypothetical protein